MNGARGNGGEDADGWQEVTSRTMRRTTRCGGRRRADANTQRTRSGIADRTRDNPLAENGGEEGLCANSCCRTNPFHVLGQDEEKIKSKDRGDGKEVDEGEDEGKHDESRKELIVSDQSGKRVCYRCATRTLIDHHSC